MPPPMHIVTSPVVSSWRSSSSSSVPISMPPVAPSGCPSAIAPPFTFTFAGSMPVSRIVLSGTVANASLISTRSMSPIVMPAFFSTFGTAVDGAVSMITGSLAVVAVARMRARGRRPCAFAYSGDASSTALAPSTMPDELPAVCTCSMRPSSG